MKKLLAFLFFIAACVRVWFDWQQTIAIADSFRFAEIGEVWANFHIDSLQSIQPAIEKYIGLWLWDYLVSPVLLAPTAPVLLIIAALFLWSGRNKRRKSMFY